MTDTIAKLTIGENTYEFPVLSGSIGPDVIDIRNQLDVAHLFLRCTKRLQGVRHLDAAAIHAVLPGSIDSRAALHTTSCLQKDCLRDEFIAGTAPSPTQPTYALRD